MNAPPPPPFAPLPPRVDEARWRKQNLRADRRAAALAARQQRTLLRAHQRSLRRRSLLGPVLLVALGIVLLVLQAGRLHPDAVFVWLSQWWPLVLVGAGCVLLSEWALDRAASRRSAGGVQPCRQLGAGAALLLVLVALAGTIGQKLQGNLHWMQRQGFLSDAWGLDQVLAQHTDLHQSLSAPLGKGALLTIQNYQGNITVTGTSQDGQVHVTVQQRLWAWQRSDLQEHQSHSRPTMEANGDGLRLRIDGKGRDSADLTVDLPHDAGLVIAAEKGAVSVSELRGPVTLAAHQGNVELTALTGSVDLTSEDDDAAISGHSLTGALHVTGRAGDLNFSDISGSLDLHGDFFGATRLERVQAPVRFQSSFTDFSCGAIPGKLEIEGRTALRAEELVGPVQLSTSDRNLTFRNVRGAVTLTNRNGPIHVALTGPLAPVSLSTTDAAIRLEVPASAALHVHGETTNGHISNDLGLPVQQHDQRVTMDGQIRSGGADIRLQTTQGDISLRRITADAKSHTRVADEDEDD